MRLDGILEGTEGCYMHKTPSRIPRVEELKNAIRAGGCVIPHDWEDEGYVFDKIYLGSDENSRPKELFGRMKDMEIIDRGNGFYECVPRGHSKATAIDQVLKHCGISLEDAYVFGDSSNDLSMFRYASNCVLMAITARCWSLCFLCYKDSRGGRDCVCHERTGDYLAPVRKWKAGYNG